MDKHEASRETPGEFQPPRPGLPAPLLARLESEGRDLLLEPEVYSLLSAAGMNVPRHRIVRSPEEVDEGLCAHLDLPGPWSR